MTCQDGHRFCVGTLRGAARHALLAAAIHIQLVGLAHAQTATSAASTASAVPSPSSSIDVSLRNDAALADVYFADRMNGWAVGDRGVIWNTADGGASWHQQASGVSCRLNSVYFIDSRRGWAAGGENRPHAHSSQGVVLQTIDGGATWSAMPNLYLPLLSRIKFFNPNTGVAIGAGSTVHPSGVFVTHDGGANWQPLPADEAGHWSAGDFLDAQAGAVAASAGEFATIAQHQVKHSPLAMPSMRAVHAMKLVAPAGGWLVGDGGLVMTTADLGHTWQSPPGALPHGAAEHFDFHALAVHSEHIWIAGSPGTRLFHSPDGGKSWQAFATDQRTPIRALTFVDTQHGWATGDLGCILATRDGGRTWQRQRAGGSRAALLAVFPRAGDVPFELLAEQGAAEGYITAVDLLHTESTDDRANDPAANVRAREAMILAGVASAETAWRFPLPHTDPALTPADLLAALNRANDGRAIELLELHLVRTLRMWRPDVIIVPHAAQNESESMTAVVEDLVRRSVEAASDPTQFVKLATSAGLDAWRIKKMYGVLPPAVHGHESVVTTKFSPWLGSSLADWVAPARRLLSMTHSTPPDTHELDQLFGEVAAATGRSDLFRGIALARGSDARRTAPEMPSSDLEVLRRMATRRKHLQELLERTEGDVAWTGQVTALIDGLDARSGGELLFQLAAGYRAAGRLDLAADSYYLLAQRYPQHPLVDDALLWLVQFYASSETAHRAGAPALVRALVHDETASEANADDAAVSGEFGRTEVRPAAFEAPAIGLAPDDRLRRAAQLVDYLKSARPALYAEPAVRFAEVAARRRLGYPNPAKRYFLSLGGRPPGDPWRRCAETEQWLAQPNDQPPPKVLAACRRTSQRPHLDGILDESFWDAADRMRLSGETETPPRTTAANRNNAADATDMVNNEPAEVRLAYDDAFFYIAVRCPKAIAVDYRPDDSPRPRDADLSQCDRVTLRLDLDRDFTTAFQLTVDHRGWTHDACWDDSAWNPSWYVAAASDETHWTIEAAVPLAELTPTAPAPKHVWAVAARRTMPRVGHESWSGAPAAGDSPDHFGILIFE
jgi:photosystem II stability/assembly factor-like uncharacterized protein